MPRGFEGKVRLSDLRERDAFYEFWWRKGHELPRRNVWVDAKKYAAFKRETKNNFSKTGFLASDS